MQVSEIPYTQPNQRCSVATFFHPGAPWTASNTTGLRVLGSKSSKSNARPCVCHEPTALLHYGTTIRPPHVTIQDIWREAPRLQPIREGPDPQPEASNKPFLAYPYRKQRPATLLNIHLPYHPSPSVICLLSPESHRPIALGPGACRNTLCGTLTTILPPPLFHHRKALRSPWLHPVLAEHSICTHPLTARPVPALFIPYASPIRMASSSKRT